MLLDLPTIINNKIQAFEDQLATAIPAIVVSFNSEEQTITAKPVGLEAHTSGHSSEFAEIDDIPVMFPSSGGGSLTFPIEAGDEVLLVFSARNYDTWWDTGESESLSTTQRYHDFSDAIAILGVRSRKNSVKASTEDVELKFKDNLLRLVKDGSVELEVKETISISNSQEELVSLISESLQLMADITSNTVYGISPVNNKVQILELKARLDTFKK